MQIKIARTMKANLIFALGLFAGTASWATTYTSPFAAPPNDNCDAASAVLLPSAGYGLGQVYTDTVDITMATRQSGEFFSQDLIQAGNDKKSVWYKLSLFTSRRVTIELLQAGNTLTLADCGMIVYRSGTCLPGSAQFVASTDKFGSIADSCLVAGDYLIQIGAKSFASGSVMLRITLEQGSAPYDLPSGAYDFQTLATTTVSVQHPLECHSIDGQEEFDCLPGVNPETYNQSSWYVFQTDAFEDLVEVEVFGSNLPEIGYRLYKGNVLFNPPASLQQIVCAKMIKDGSAFALYEHLCELEPNTTYSVQLLFPSGYSYSNLRVTIRHRGVQATGAPVPIQSQMAPANQLGAITPTFTGVSKTVADYLSCNARLALNDCGPVNPAAGINALNDAGQSVTYDLATWITFSITEDANVEFTFPSLNSNYRYFRVFRGMPAACGDLDPATDLVAAFTNYRDTIRCLPAGDYCVQILACSGYPFAQPANNYNDAYSYGYLGVAANTSIRFKKAHALNTFNLSAANRVDNINNFLPLQPNTAYTAKPDTLGCGVTVLPASGACDSARYALIARKFRIDPDSGLLRIDNLRTHKNTGFNESPAHIFYRLYPYDLNALSVSQGAFLPGQTIDNEPPNPFPCITYSDNIGVGLDSCFACVMPGEYSFTAFGGPEQVNAHDQPSFRFRRVQTAHPSRSLAENLGDLTNSSITLSGADQFSCADNPAIVGGLAPCNGYTKLIYREFYLSEEKIVHIARDGDTVGVFRLYKGRASDLTATLTAWVDTNSVGQPWVSCFTDQQTNECYPLTPGWYTVVSYGRGPDYANPFFGAKGDKSDVGKTERIRIEILQAQKSKYNRPFKAYDAGITDWDVANNNVPYATTAKSYILGTEIFTCTPDAPLTLHPVTACAAGENRTAYYVFTITEPSFVSIENIPADFSTKVFAFDVRKDSALMLTQAPIYPCVNTTLRQFCELQPGVYTLVIFAKDSDQGKMLTPRLYVDKSATSRFDHAVSAYDFGEIPQDGIYYDGRVGDVHPFDPSLPPSHDIYYCTTGAHLSDPVIDSCGLALNPNIYPNQANNVLYTTPPGNLYPLRNLWYTFVLSGTGNVEISIDHPALAAQRPTVGVYSSDVDGSLPFAQLIASGGIDSTLADGLALIVENYSSCASANGATLKFTKSGCYPDYVRYYVVVSLRDENPNLAFSMSILYDGKPTPPAPYDSFPTANVINGLGETQPPYTPVVLPAGTYLGAPFQLPCYTRSADDPFSWLTSFNRTVWYKLETSVTGIARFAIDKNLDISTRKEPGTYAFNVFKAGPAGDVASLTSLNLGFFFNTDPLNPTGYSWRTACIEPGTYYIMCTDYSTFDLVSVWQPVVWLEDQGGDHCTNAVPVVLPGSGTASATMTINCHTMGGDYGENGANQGCLPGPTSLYISSFFKVTLSDTLKQDLAFALDENTTTTPSNIAYRILGGQDCSSLSAGSCSANANTLLTLNCLAPSDYFVQVFTRRPVTGTLTLTVTATPSPDQDCASPFDLLADFQYQADCDSIYFESTSNTPVPDPTFLWTFQGGQTFTTTNPVIAAPPGQDSILVQLTVSSVAYSLTSSTSEWVFLNHTSLTGLRSATICPGETFDFYGQPLAASGVYEQKFTLPDGCDSTDQLTLTVLPQQMTHLSDSICSGSSYKFGDLIFTQGGVYYDTLIAASNCDSIIELSLKELSGTSSLTQASICEGDSFYFDNQYLSAPGTYYDTLTAINGCDSLIKLQLSVFLKETIALDQKTCNPALVGIDTMFLQTIHGCDSTVFVVTTYDSTLVDVTQQSEFVCDPDQAGIFTQTYSTDDGCDSVVVTTRVFDPNAGAKNTIHEFTCNPMLVGIDTMFLQTIHGCDSTVLIVMAYDSTLVEVTQRSEFVCDPDQAGAITQTFTASDGCDSIVITNRLPDPNANMVVAVSLLTCDPAQAGMDTLHLQTILGCDSTVVLTTELREIPVTEIEATICYGEDFSFNGMIVNTSGTYYDSIPISGRCDSIVQLQLLVSGISVDLGPDLNLYLGESVLLEPALNGNVLDSLSWTHPEFLSCVDCLNPVVSPTTSTVFSLEVWDANGCKSVDEVVVLVDKKARIYVPNAFSPDGDGENDRFWVFTGPEVRLIRRMQVFDRWGNQVYTAESLAPNGYSTGWDGMFRGSRMLPGVYTWYMVVEYTDATTEIFSGDVTLIR